MINKKIECFSKDQNYSRFELGLDLAKLKDLEILDEKKTILGLLSLYSVTAMLIFISIKLIIY